MSIVQQELIDYCNGRGGRCSDTCIYKSKECDAFMRKYGTTPFLYNEKIAFGGLSFSELESIINACEMRGDHEKVIELLKELQESKQSEIIRCTDCKNKSFCPQKIDCGDGLYFYVGFCSHAERRADEGCPPAQPAVCNVCTNLIEGDTLYCMSDWDGGIGFDYIRNIQFCPICGRKLSKD